MSCTTPQDKQSFLNALEFTFTLAVKHFNSLNQIDKFQLYQVTTLANRKDIIIHLLAMSNFFEPDGDAKISKTLDIASLNLRDLACNVSVKKNIHGIAVDLFLENTFFEGKPVIIQLKTPYRLTRSGKDTGSALLQSKYLRQLGYHVVTDPMNDPTIAQILQAASPPTTPL